MNPNDVEIVRVYTREYGGTIADFTPHISVTGGGSFEVVVEAEAGSVQQGIGAPYQIAIEACDLTTCSNPPAPFDQSHTGSFNPGAFPAGWPAHAEVFTITLTAAQAALVRDHIFRYVAYLRTPTTGKPLIVSFAESPLFVVSATD